jgi:hypothetical protein
MCHSKQLSTVRDAGKGNPIFQIRLFKVVHIPRLTACPSFYLCFDGIIAFSSPEPTQPSGNELDPSYDIDTDLSQEGVGIRRESRRLPSRIS